MLITAAALAIAGELVVTTTTPVVVKVDGMALDYVPGTMTVQVSGMTGIHRVEVASMSGQTLRSMNVNIPANGGTQVLYDGVNLAMASAGMDASVSVSIGGVAAAPAPAPAAPQAMDGAAFGRLLRAVQSGSFSDDRLNAIRTAAAGNWFTIDQVGQLVDQMSFGEDRVSVVKLCRAKVVDPQNAFALADHFSFSEDREEALAQFQ